MSRLVKLFPDLRLKLLAIGTVQADGLHSCK